MKEVVCGSGDEHGDSEVRMNRIVKWLRTISSIVLISIGLMIVAGVI